MKKRLFLLPLVGGLLLSGCSLEDLMFWKKKVKDSDLPANTLREFQGYKLATEVKDGKRYLLGDYRHREDLMRFANGDYHWDSGKSYPFYMGTVAGRVEGAAEFEVKYLNKSAGEFSLQVFADGMPWNQKYVGVYAAKSTYGNQVMSIALLDDPNQTTYKEPNTGSDVRCSGVFKFYEKYEDMPAYAPAAPFAYPEVDPEPVPKFLGSSLITQEDYDKGEPDYISIDCKKWEDALSPDKYDLGHLYEKK